MMRRVFLTAVLVMSVILSSTAETFSDSDNGYSVVVPKGWRAVKKSEKLVKADVSAPGDAAGANIRVYPSGGRNLKGFVAAYLPLFEKEMSRGSRVVEISRSYERPGGYPGCQVSYRMERGGKPTYLLKSYIWVRGEKVYWFQCGAEWKNRARYEKVLDGLAASVKFF